MLDHVFNSIQGTFTAKGLMRGLWAFLMLALLLVCFETQTSYFELQSLSSRLQALEQFSKPPVSAEQTTKIERVKNELMEELEVVQSTHRNPIGKFSTLGVRFLQGAWVALPFFILLFKIMLWGFKRNDNIAKPLTIQFGFMGISLIAWIATLLGIISAAFNRSPNILVSWFLFPFCSAIVVVFASVWIFMLRTLIPDESKSEAKK